MTIDNVRKAVEQGARARGGRHRIVCIEQEAPGVFEIRCTCGQTTWTPWGQSSAQEIAKIHLYAVGAPPQAGFRD